jgi:hypothetical protein
MESNNIIRETQENHTINIQISKEKERKAIFGGFSLLLGKPNPIALEEEITEEEINEEELLRTFIYIYIYIYIYIGRRNYCQRKWKTNYICIQKQ